MEASLGGCVFLIDTVVVALGATTVLAVVIMLTVRHFAPPKGYLNDAVPATGVFGVLGVAFAVLLAFVVFLAFEGYVRTSDGASREAVAVSQLARTARLLPEEQGKELRGSLACYARAVVHDEWPLMAAGRESELVEEWLARIEATVDQMEVDSPRTEVAFGHWLEQMADRRDGRRARLLQAEPVVPDAVWLVLVIGALLTIGYLTVFADPRDRWWVQAVMIGSVTMLVTAGMLLIVFLDRPYQPDGAFVAPVEMQTTIDFMERDAAGDPTFRPPCDEQGHRIAALRPSD
jgi:hypothetical protein